MKTTPRESGIQKSMAGVLVVASLLTGLCSAYLIFVFFLQTPVVSGSRLALAGFLAILISAAAFLAARKWVAAGLLEYSSARRNYLGLCFVLPAIFLPLYYVSPAYPQSPLLRPWTDLAIQFGPASDPVTINKDSLKLVLGQEVVGPEAFLPGGEWQSNPNALTLPPGSTGSLEWDNPAPQAVSLTILPPGNDVPLVVYWDGTRTTLPLSRGLQGPVVLLKKYPLPWGFNLLFFLSWYVLIVWLLILLLVRLRSRFEFLERLEQWRPLLLIVLALVILLTLLTVKLQIDSLPGGLNYLTGEQMDRHSAVLAGQAPDPWQYRLLSEWLAEAMIRFYQFLRVPMAMIPAFITFRLLQNAAIFWLAFALYRKITGSNLLALLAVGMLAGSMKNAFYDNDLSFNTYFDVLFYLLSALLLLARNYYAVVFVTIFAALNRETSGLIPFLMAGAILENPPPSLKKYLPVLLSAGIYAFVFIGLRLWFPGRPLYIPYKHPPGFPLLLYNLTRQFSWDQLSGTLGLIPLLGLVFYPAWPRLWQRFFLIVCPVWFVIHLFASVIDETRLFLVPQALIFIPGALFALKYLLAANPQPEKEYAVSNEPR